MVAPRRFNQSPAPDKDLGIAAESSLTIGFLDPDY
jgi:hypothetical protein